MEWTKADPALIGQDAIYHGPVDRIIEITNVSDDLMYYWGHDEIFPSFLVEPIGENEQIAIAQIPGPGARVDDHTVMAEGVELDLSARPPITCGGFQELPIGKVLDIWREGKRVFMKAKVNKDICLSSGAEVEFYPAFLVREMRIIDGERIINAADLLHFSMGFKYTPQVKEPWWKRLWAWMCGLVARIGIG